MSFEVKSIGVFEKQAKRLVKKYSSLRHELFDLIQTLKENPEQGVSLGRHCYKIRISIASKGKGKSGGARVITNFLVHQKTVYLLSIYDKAERDALSNNELTELLAQIPE